VFSRVAIVNRGEAAMRLIHAVRDLSAQTGDRIETVALYTDADRGATFVREADDAYFLGAASARPYLDHPVLEKALAECGADAAWVGWGFVAEDPGFAALCEKTGVTFIGPSADAMRQLGDKIGAKLIAEEVGVPVAPWSRGPVATLEDALAQAERIGYPLMLKATAGGGGRGIRKVMSAGDLTEAFDRTSEEALRAFGSGTVFLESLVTGARHVEVQVIADGQDTAWALGVRDCSVQRRNQKIIEESSSPLLSQEQVEDLKTSAERLALAVGYRGAATVEFLYHPGEKRFAFLEVNTRLQVEHPITELTTGTDLVRLQLHVASGGKLEGGKPAESGHAIEARLNAEDPDRDFAPAPGRIAALNLPAGPGIRVDTGVSEGDTIPADFDSMIAKIIAYGRDRDQALGRLRRAMAETTVVIEGGATNKSFVLDLLAQPEVIDASADTGWIDRVRGEGRLTAREHSAVALVAAAIEAYAGEEEVSTQRLLATAHGGRPQAEHEAGRPLDFKLRGDSYRVRVTRLGPDRYRAAITAGDGVPRTADAVLERFDAHSGRITVNGRRFRLTSATHGPVHLVEVDGVAHRISRDEGGVVRSPAPALVVATPLSAGDEVAADAPVLVLESMKMETVLRAPFRARLRECMVSVGSQVGAGAPLLRLEPLADEVADEADNSKSPEGGAAVADEAELDLPEPPALTADERARRYLADLRGLLLGFDGRADEKLADGYLAARAELGGQPLDGEPELLAVFADLSELSRNRPGSDLKDEPGAAAHSPREYFHSYLQSLDTERAGLPDTFQAKLEKVLGRYGVTDLDRTPELETSVFRIFLAQQRMGAGAAIVSAILREWLASAPPAEPLRERAGLALEHLIEATQRRFPAVGDLARGVAFRWFAQPMLRRSRARAYTTARADLRYLDANPDAPDRAERIQDMVAITEPLLRIIGQRIERGGDLDHAPMLEVLTRRYYGNRKTIGFAAGAIPGGQLLTATADGTRIVATATDIGHLGDAVAEVDFVAKVAKERKIEMVADLYVNWGGDPDPDALAARTAELLAARELQPRVTRVTVTAAGTTMQSHVTFVRGAAGFTEDRLIRGLHPQIAERLQLGRLREFDLTRLPSADEEIYLFKAAAKSNAKDERLIAMGQVRDLTPLREADGRLVALPALEDILAGCLDAIRGVQAQRPERKRFEMNRVLLYVWPTVDLAFEEMESLVHRIRPTVSGAGLEEVEFVARMRDPIHSDGDLAEVSVVVKADAGGRAGLQVAPLPEEPLQPLDDYRQKVLRAARRGNVYPTSWLNCWPARTVFSPSTTWIPSTRSRTVSPPLTGRRGVTPPALSSAW